MSRPRRATTATPRPSTATASTPTWAISAPGFDAASPLTGDHTFSRLNPAIGFTRHAARHADLLRKLQRGQPRADRDRARLRQSAAPCGLPNDFASDPDLKQVVARTFEDRRCAAISRISGCTGAPTCSARSTGTTSSSSPPPPIPATSTTSAPRAARAWTWRSAARPAGCAGTSATASSMPRSSRRFEVSAESNSSADADGNILVRPGDRLPLMPRHTGKLALDYQLTPALDLGGTFTVTSGSYLHGNENNANQAGATNAAGDFIAGSGWIGGYALVNIQGTYHARTALRPVRAHRQPAEPAVCDGGISHHQHLHRQRRIPAPIRTTGPTRMPSLPARRSASGPGSGYTSTRLRDWRRAPCRSRRRRGAPRRTPRSGRTAAWRPYWAGI